MTAFDLSGAWSGWYEQNGGRHGISMQVAQRGGSFVGRMRDADTVLASRGEVRAEVGDGDGDERRTTVIGEAEMLSTLPENSVVEGEVDGRIVTFVKRYQGKTSTSVWIDGKGSFDAEFPGHDVQYLGTLAAHGDELAGHWSIPASDTRPELRGRFRLRRARDAAR